MWGFLSEKSPNSKEKKNQEKTQFFQTFFSHGRHYYKSIYVEILKNEKKTQSSRVSLHRTNRRPV